MADDVEEGGPEAEVEPTPEDAADRRGQDEHDVPAGQVDRRVEQGRQSESIRAACRRSRPLLKEPAPEELLPGSDDEADKRCDAEERHAGPQSVDVVDPGPGGREDAQGHDAPDGKEGIKRGGRNDAERRLSKETRAKIQANSLRVAAVNEKGQGDDDDDVQGEPGPEVERAQAPEPEEGDERIAASAPTAPTRRWSGRDRLPLIATAGILRG